MPIEKASQTQYITRYENFRNVFFYILNILF